MAKEPTLTELGDMRAHVVKHMATKDDVAAIRQAPSVLPERYDRLAHHGHILEMNGDGYRLKQSAGRRRKSAGAE